MNTESTKGLYRKLTEGIFFSEDRHITKQMVEKVLNRIGPNLDKKDADILFGLEVCAPSPKAFCETIPTTETPTVWLNPQIETERDEEVAEFAIVTGFAQGIRLVQGTGRNQLEQRSHELARDWGYNIPAASRRGEAVGA